MKKIIALTIAILTSNTVLSDTTYQNELEQIKKIQLHGKMNPEWKNVKNEGGLPAKMFRHNHQGFNSVKCHRNNDRILKRHYPELKRERHRKTAIKTFPFFCVIPFNQKTTVVQKNHERAIENKRIRKEKRNHSQKRRNNKEYKAWENWNTDLKEFDMWNE